MTQIVDVTPLYTTAGEIKISAIVWTDLFFVEEIPAFQVSYQMLLPKYKGLLCVHYEKA